MRVHWMVRALALLALVGGFATTACSKDKTSKIEPEARGQRGESCQARNDCASGLACLNGTCTQDEFPISVDARHCDRIDCETDQDCCGDVPTEAPGQCADYSLICEQYTLSACSTSYCETDTDCGGGSCSLGLYCSNTSADCVSDADCTDICSGGYCLYSGGACSVDTDCALGVCSGTPYCDCTNPAYDPTAAICSDPACDTDVCIYRCDEDQRCSVDTSCESDGDCSSLSPRCVEGACVECADDADCDEEDGERCLSGSCEAPCVYNEECDLMEACDGGECVPRGCESDRECVLFYARFGDGAEDARLYKCLPSDDDPSLKECKVPCESDGGCQEFEACDGGYCKFVGCTTADECRWWLNLANEGDGTEWTSRAVCRE
jgi:hypothetical protein